MQFNGPDARDTDRQLSAVPVAVPRISASHDRSNPRSALGTNKLLFSLPPSSFVVSPIPSLSSSTNKSVVLPRLYSTTKLFWKRTIDPDPKTLDLALHLTLSSSPGLVIVGT